VGGSGEFKAGQVGSAGRRSILELDRPIRDVVAVVVQHQSAYGDNGRHYSEGESAIGWSGASANGSDWGGDVHLHVHCLTASGARRKFTDYFVTASYPSGPASTPIKTPIDNPITPEEDDVDDLIYLYSPGVDDGARYVFSRRSGKVVRGVPKAEWDFLSAIGKTASGAPTPVVTVSENWLRKAQAL
jgi:hypothetical protein